MESYDYFLIAANVLALLLLFIEFKIIKSGIGQSKKYADSSKSLIVMVLVFLMVLIGGGAAVTGYVTYNNITSLEKDIASIKQISTNDPQVNDALSQLPSNLKKSEDFDKLNELIKVLEKKLAKLNELNLDEDNEKLKEELEDLNDELEDLRAKVNSIGVVVGVY